MSSKANPLDMTGQWHGTYVYPGKSGPATPFIATITESTGAFAGSIIEPDTVYATGDTLEAGIAGHRSGRSVDFTKTYAGHRIGYENPVDYVGQISADGQSVTGMWSLRSMNGAFEMFRELGLEEQLSAEETVELREPVETKVTDLP